MCVRLPNESRSTSCDKLPIVSVLFPVYTFFKYLFCTRFQVVSLRTKYMALDVVETELLPSDVIKIKFYRPPNFKYLSGQWVRLSCTAFRTEEFHSFTLTSAPHEVMSHQGTGSVDMETSQVL